MTREGREREEQESLCVAGHAGVQRRAACADDDDQGGGQPNAADAVVCVVFAVSGAVLLIQSLTGRANDETGGLLFARKEWLAIVALLACWALMPALGCFASIFLMLMAISLIMAEGWTARTVGRQAALNLAFTACLYVVFVVLLQMVTPSGLII